MTDSAPAPGRPTRPWTRLIGLLAIVMVAGLAEEAGAQKPATTRKPKTAQKPPPPPPPKPVPPDQVARAVVRADSAGDWGALIRLAHPDALVRFRAMQAFQLRMLDQGEGPGMEVPATPVDSATQARWQRARARQQRVLLDSVFRVPGVDSLTHTSPDTVFARWFRWSRTPVAGDSAGRDSTARDPAWSASIPPPQGRVIGAVMASDSLAYVVIEREVEQPLGPMPELFRDYPQETRRAEVMVMRRHGKEWRSMLDGVGGGFAVSPELEHGE